VIVVSNTSPITNLAAIGQLDLLFHLYEEIIIPDAVWDELRSMGRDWPGTQEVRSASWITQRSATNTPLVELLTRDLDRGEAEAIALALEIGAELLLLDEREGRRAAKRLGLAVIGILGILLDAKRHGCLSAVRPLLASLQQEAGFYLTDSLVRLVLDLAEE
jgi:predicted nucleic acid-binding protein